MYKKDKKVMSIIGSALTLSLTACGGNTVNTFESADVNNVVDISTNGVNTVTLGASLDVYYDENVTTVVEGEEITNNENMVSNTIVELEVSEIPVPPTETIPTTITTVTTTKKVITAKYLYAYESWGNVTGITTTLNIRSEPNTSSSVIGSLHNYDEIHIVSKYQNSNGEIWCRINYPMNGYVIDTFVFCGGDKEKPIIYLYPPKATEVSVKLELNGHFTYTYPEYNNGWNVTAHPDGTIIDADGNEYSYLFWEGNGHIDYALSKGFVVERSNVTQFLKEKLLYMGLTQKEANEFIVYWSPRLMKNPYSLVTFQGEAYENYAKLSVSPKPDSILRVFMVFKAVDKDYSIPPQELSTFERVGFSVVEWGGEEL